MHNDCIFCKILDGSIPSDKVHEDDEYLAFKDINPAAPVHVLVIPKRHIPSLSEAAPDDRQLLGGLMLAAGETAKKIGLEDYRLIINNGPGAGQTVFHIHAHILGGKKLGEKLL